MKDDTAAMAELQLLLPKVQLEYLPMVRQIKVNCGLEILWFLPRRQLMRRKRNKQWIKATVQQFAAKVNHHLELDKRHRVDRKQDATLVEVEGFQCSQEYVVDLKQFQPNEEITYVIANGRAAKIGYSTNPMKRLQELQVGNDLPLKLAAVFRGGAKLERKLHRLLEKTVEPASGSMFRLTK